MGRYANFKPTDISYKFEFACQDSSDIECWQGKRTGYCKLQWVKSQAPQILEQLKSLSFDGKLPHDFDKFSQTTDGTSELYHDMLDNDYDCFYKIGAIIYHQLLYTEVLDVEYEI